MSGIRRHINLFGFREILQRRVPLMALDSGRPGPVVWLTACIHGDEAGGIAIVHDVFAALKKDPLAAGQLYAFPLVNSMGFENVSRYINQDQEDLNRCFPGKNRGSMGERIAHRLYAAIMEPGPDLLIDIHNDWIRSIPYVVLDPRSGFRSNKVYNASHRYALATGLLVVEDADTFDAGSNTLAGALAADGIASLTLEAGGASAVSEGDVRIGVDAILRVLAAAGMIDQADRPAYLDGMKHLPSSVTQYSNEPLCSASGLLRFVVRPADYVTKGKTVARIYNAFGTVEEVLKAKSDGVVLGYNDHAVAMPGKEVIAVANIRSTS